MAIRGVHLSIKKLYPLFFFILATLIAACGGGSDGETDTTTADTDTSTPESEVVATATCDNGSTETAEVKQIGTVSGVEGLAYESETIASVDGIKKTITGVTTASGEYEYFEVCGETSETDICHIKKCIDDSDEEVVSGAEVIANAEIENSRVRPGVIGRFTSTTEPKTIRDVIYATYADESDEDRKRITVNVYQFLMALDDDNDPNNGVRVSERKLELGQQFADKIDFTRSDFDDREEVKDYLRNVVEKENIEIGSDENAKLFLQENLASQNRFIISGRVIGATGKVTLMLNGSETIHQSLEGRFFFHTELQTGDQYRIEIIDTGEQNCRIGRYENTSANWSSSIISLDGVIENSSINNVVVGCGDIPETNPDSTSDPTDPNTSDGTVQEEPLDSSDPRLEDRPLIEGDPSDPTV